MKRAAARAQPRARPTRAESSTDITRDLLAWYDRERRHLPWRYAPGVTADPYRVWLSEIMLQQTVAKTVTPYFTAFTSRWATIEALAAAPLDDVLKAWAGLGYYARARNLHLCARVVVERHAGRFPADEAALRALPGVGPYTAAAISAIGHGLKATPIDGNIERVVSRLFAIETPLPDGKPEIRQAAEQLTPNQRAGDFAQAMMDLGAGVCTPRAPSCLVCPLRHPCRARAGNIAERLPIKAAKAARPTRRATAFVALRNDGHVLLRRRPEAGLLGGMMEVPSSEWSTEPAGPVEAAAPLKANWQVHNQPVVHIFTHFRLELSIARASVAERVALRETADPARCRWVALSALPGEALPSVMRKVLESGLGASEVVPAKVRRGRVRAF